MMRAAVCEQYGAPDVLQIREVESPHPKADEVLIRVHAATVTPSDTLMRSGSTVMTRVILGFRKPRPRYRIPGTEFAGVVEATGEQVRRFKPGDAVYGFRGFGTGTCAEYKCMSARGSVALKPANMSFEQAAALVDGATTALFFLRDKARIESGQQVLINGASGSIGTYAVQIAKYLGADVTGVCSTRNIELVASLGADRVIDYTAEDFVTRGETYDVIFDTVGKRSFAACKPALKPDGCYMVTTGNIVANFIQSGWSSVVGGKRMIYAMSVDKREALEVIKDFAESDIIRPVIDMTYPLDEIVEAHRYVDTGRKRGNVVITIDGQ